MKQMIYASASINYVTILDLIELMRHARNNNERLSVTGFLMYDAGSFLQVLEGPEGVIEDLYKSITKDPRHSKVRLLSSRLIAEREFGDWAMSFAFPEGRGLGVVDYDEAREDFWFEGSEASQVLAMFQDGLLRQADHREDRTGNFTVTLGLGPKSDERRMLYLMNLGRAVSLTVPEVRIVITPPADN